MIDERPQVLMAAPLPAFLREPLEAAYVCHDMASVETHLADIRAVIPLGGTTLSSDFLNRLPKLEIISVMGVGYDGVPIPWCREHGVRVTNTPDVLTDDVADIAVALVLAWAAERWLRWWVPLVLLLPLGWGTLHRIPAWHDSHALWAADASRPGDHWVRRLKFGTVLGREGDFAGAEREFRAAEALQPGRSDVLARRLLAELAKDGWTSQDAAVARGLQPPPTTAEQWAHITDVLVQVQHPSACDASAQTVHLGGPAHPSCP